MIYDKIKSLSKLYFDEVIGVRRHLHQHPELSFDEFKTSEYIQNKLSELNIPFQSGFVKTGITAIIKGDDPESKTIALRADMDALPITEENDVPFKSKNSGVMHACGHDVHCASLIGTARILQEIKSEIKGTVKLIFQPGEEKLPGGASLMIKEGVLKNPEPKGIFGQHVFPDLEAGKVGFRSGMYMASADEIYITINGKGGHAALPHKNIDPVVIASQIIVSLQQIISRFSKADIPAVLSFGKIIANGATNVIPDKVFIEGTFRTMDEDMRFSMHKKMTHMAQSIASGMGGTCDFDIKVGYPFLVNDEQLTQNAIQTAVQYLGKEKVCTLDLRMTSEDFAYFSQEIPGCFYRLGTASPNEELPRGLHTSTFNIEEKAIETGMGLMAALTIDELNRK